MTHSCWQVRSDVKRAKGRTKAMDLYRGLTRKSWCWSSTALYAAHCVLVAILLFHRPVSAVGMWWRDMYRADDGEGGRVREERWVVG